MDQVTTTNPKSRGWTTPPSSWRWWRIRRRRWRPRWHRPAGVFPLQSVAPGLCFVISVFRRHSLLKGVGRLFLWSFLGQDEARGKDRRHRRLEAQDSGPHAAKESGRVGQPILAHGSPLVRFLRSYASFLPKTDARKFPGHSDVVWVPETSKYRK